MQSKSWIRIFVVSSLAMVAAAAFVGGCSSNGSSGGGGLSGSMSGSQVVPEVITIRTGSFSLMITADEIYVNITITHDIPDLTAAAIHGAALAGETAPVIFDVLANQTNLPGVRGDIKINSPIEAQWPINAEQLMYLRDGQTYVQLASLLFPDGELRGQVNGPTEPDPAQGDVVITAGDFNFTYIENTFFDTGVSWARDKAAEFKISSSYNIELDWNFRVEADWGMTVPEGITETLDLDTNELILDGPDFPANSSFTIPLGLSMAPMDTRELECFFEADDVTTGFMVEGFSFPFMRNFRPASHLQFLDMTANAIGGPTLVESFYRNTRGFPIFRVRLSLTGSSLTLGTGAQQITGNGAMTGSGDIYDPARTIPAFPCGSFDDGNGLVVCPFDQGPVSTGPWFYVAMIVEDTVPLADPTNSYQYGFVFDTDDNPNNNFVAAKAFENDFFQDTDWWYSLEYNPMDGWRLFNIDARTPGTPQRQFSDASVIIWGNMLFLAAPRSEFLSDSPNYRLTAFRHPGDFGAGGVFNLDFDPPIGEPLIDNPVSIITRAE